MLFIAAAAAVHPDAAPHEGLMMLEEVADGGSFGGQGVAVFDLEAIDERDDVVDLGL